ncbi:MAG: hypothetical protein N3B14_05850 [Thermoleophilia bacterium]|nr:hypothetical protein [Thermoleophilia bacterium]
MAKKKYDPLWEIVGDKRALQNQEQHFDFPCPHCHVVVHLGSSPRQEADFSLQDGASFECGLCGGRFVVRVGNAGDVCLERL